MQREAPAVASPTPASVDRTQMVYNAHSALEESLSSVDALSKAVTAQSRAMEGFDPQAMLRQSLSDVRRHALVCLRLFSPLRTLRSTRGMDSVSALYGSSHEPTQRVTAFLGYLRARLDGALPAAISISAVRVAKRSSPAVAAQMAFDELTQALSCTNSSPDANSGTVTAQAVRALDTPDGWQKAVTDLAGLEAECAASVETDASALSLSVLAPELARCLPTEAVQALLAHEEACRQQAPALRQIVSEQTAKRAAFASAGAATASPPPSSSAPSPPSAAGGVTNTASATVARAAPSAGAGAGQTVAPPGQDVASSPAGHTTGSVARLLNGQSGWKGHAIKALGAVVLLLLVRLLASRLYDFVKGAASLAHGAPARRRTLTL